MKTYLLNLFISILAIAALSSCSSINPDADIREAENAMAAGEYDRAYDICSSLVDKDSKNLTATQYAHLSILFMQLTDVAEDPNTIAHATQCWHKAMELNPDSAAHFYSTVPVEQQKNVVLLTAIISMFDHSDVGMIDLDTEIPADSMPEFPADHDIDPADIHSHE